ncbi:hypothetical protein GH714_038110 [Hevea brasiliensis]|uniref:Uncharacterized protein n=1 Tax=Hevea brasiliensis TaxID=3981 RepID=A0A6A6KE10_HEVBR|nr:hypothetical protein GH714_038110 [Hevea brasiliensis]
MAKGGKLTKLKSVLKKLNSFNKQSRSIADTVDSSSSTGDLHPVFVGKSRRRYLNADPQPESLDELVEFYAC